MKRYSEDIVAYEPTDKKRSKLKAPRLSKKQQEAWNQLDTDATVEDGYSIIKEVQ